MNANQLFDKLITAEMSHPAPDGRRVIRYERLRLQVTMQSGNRGDISEAGFAKQWQPAQQFAKAAQ